jgi:hypothetical protein
LFTLQDLLDQAFPRNPRAGIDLARSTLNTWESHARTLHALSGCALWDGHVLAAADLQETANRFERWGKCLATLLAKSDARYRPSGSAPPAD